MTEHVRIIVNGYRRQYVTDTTELSPRRSDAAVFNSHSDMARFNSFMAFLEPMYADRIDLDVDVD
jgi:hypothetical protein